MYLLVWLFGSLVGTILFILAGLLLTFKLLISPRLVPKLPELILPEPLTDLDASELEVFEATESAEWLNLLANWLISNFLELPRVQEAVKRGIEEGVVDIRRTILGRLLTNSQLVDVDFGDSFLKIACIQRIKHQNLAVKCDFEYTGGIQLLVKLDFIMNASVYLDIRLDTLKVPVLFVLKEKAFYIGFDGEAEAANVNIQVSFTRRDSPCYSIPLLNRLLSNNILPSLFKSALIPPNFLAKWYRSAPPQPPYPWTPLSDPCLLYTWRPESH